MNRLAPRQNTSGHKGVWWHKANSVWVAEIHAYGRKEHIGCYQELMDAVEARVAREKELHGEFARSRGNIHASCILLLEGSAGKQASSAPNNTDGLSELNEDDQTAQ